MEPDAKFLPFMVIGGIAPSAGRVPATPVATILLRRTEQVE